jgi:FtsZ-binding cell division protein ZapB
MRFLPGWPARPAPGLAGPTSGVVTGESGDLAAAARRIRLLQEEVDRMRDELANLQTEASARRGQVAALDGMLVRDSLTEAPAFLREDTTVRALQQIMREAAEAPGDGAREHDRLSTAATVARERLRSKLESLRDQLTREAAELDAQAEALRLRVRLRSEELESLQHQVQRELHSRLHPQDEPLG